MRTNDPRFATSVAISADVVGAARDRPIGRMPDNPLVVRSCRATTCGYYQELQWSAMAAAHAAGVAAPIVSAYGRHDRVHEGLTLPPATTTRLLYRTARSLPCPSPRTYHYTRITTVGVVETDATRVGPTAKNGFYGHGVVNAFNAVS